MSEKRAEDSSAGAEPTPSGAPRESFDSRLRKAVALHRNGDISDAEDIYLDLLRENREHPDALHFLGVLRHQQGLNDHAIALIRSAVELAPDYVDAWNNLGNVSRLSGQLAEAGEAYRRALALNADHAGAWNNLAIVLCAQRDFAGALAAHRRVIELVPEQADAYYNYANTLRAHGDLDEALAAYRSAIGLDPGHPRASNRVGYMLYLVGRKKEAEDVFRSWLAAEPGNPVARHMLAACTGENVPDRASDEYVRITFDDMAESFDELLIERLAYRAPDLIAQGLASVLGPPAADLDVLDAGCGTGLCAPLLRPYARSLTGVDLSPGMIRRSVARGVYDEVCLAEITRYLHDSPGRFDVIASADTIVYFGALEEVMIAAQGALRPGGWLAFTVEKNTAGETYGIGPHGRFGHGEAYLRSVLDAAGFADVSVTPVVPRREAGVEVDGYLVMARVQGSGVGR